MADTLSPADRSARMALVRARGNRSTEAVAERALTKHRIKGWVKHARELPGTPDFYFPRHRLAVFIDGCFWHACPKCGRLPKSHVEFWTAKIDKNRRRDVRVRRALRKAGYGTMRVWEHEVNSDRWIARLTVKMAVIRASRARTERAN